MNYARIENNVAAQVLRVNPASIFDASFATLFAPCAEEVQPGWLWDGETFTAPPPVPEPLPLRHITKLAFDNRFTTTELVTIEMFSLDNPAASMAQRQMAANMRVNQRKIDRSTFIDLDRVDTRDGVLQLETGGILSVGRALLILDAPIAKIERFKP